MAHSPLREDPRSKKEIADFINGHEDWRKVAIRELPEVRKIRNALQEEATLNESYLPINTVELPVVRYLQKNLPQTALVAIRDFLKNEESSDERQQIVGLALNSVEIRTACVASEVVNDVKDKLTDHLPLIEKHNKSLSVADLKDLDSRTKAEQLRMMTKCYADFEYLIDTLSKIADYHLCDEAEVLTKSA